MATKTFASKTVDKFVGDKLDRALTPFEISQSGKQEASKAGESSDLSQQASASAEATIEVDPRKPHIGAPAGIFTYTPLLSPKHIRVITVLPSLDKTAPLIVRMSQVSLSKTWGRTKYSTLSHPPCTKRSPVSVLIDGAARDVSDHCDLALRHARDGKKEKTIWVPEVCVDMECGDEGGRLMEIKKEVFRKQSGVVTWAPPERKTDNPYHYLMIDIVEAAILG